MRTRLINYINRFVRQIPVMNISLRKFYCGMQSLFINLYTMMTLKFTEFRYGEFWKVFLAIALVMVYALIEIYILKIHTDPMYFMPHGDIQEDILGIDYGLYLAGYISVVLIYINVPYLIQDRENVKAFFGKLKAGVKK